MVVWGHGSAATNAGTHSFEILFAMCPAGSKRDANKKMGKSPNGAQVGPEVRSKGEEVMRLTRRHLDMHEQLQAQQDQELASRRQTRKRTLVQLQEQGQENLQRQRQQQRQRRQHEGSPLVSPPHPHQHQHQLQPVRSSKRAKLRRDEAGASMDEHTLEDDTEPDAQPQSLGDSNLFTPPEATAASLEDDRHNDSNDLFS